MAFRKKIFIHTKHAGKSFCAVIYLDQGLHAYTILDRHLDPFSFRRYEWSENPDMALRIEYTAYYNAIQILLNQLIRSGKITKKMAERGFTEWLSSNPIPGDLPRSPLSTAFCSLPTSFSSSLSLPGEGQGVG